LGFWLNFHQQHRAEEPVISDEFHQCCGSKYSGLIVPKQQQTALFYIEPSQKLNFGKILAAATNERLLFDAKRLL